VRKSKIVTGDRKYNFRDKNPIRSAKSVEDIANQLEPPPRKKAAHTANIPTSNMFKPLERNDDDFEMDTEQSEINESNSQFRPPLHGKQSASTKPKPIVVLKTTHEMIKNSLSILKVKFVTQKLRAT
jgi:hypothetical protein